MSKQKKELTKKQKMKKKIRKTVRKAFKPKNIGKALIALAAISLLATSILPYLY